MGQIIALPSSREPTRRAPAGDGAQILFFMGVRYYRMSDEAFAQAVSRKPRRAEKAKAEGPKVRHV